MDAEHLVLSSDERIGRARQTEQTRKCRGMEKAAGMTNEGRPVGEIEINAGRVCRLTTECARVIREYGVDPDH